jgi:hypothetical protein
MSDSFAQAMPKCLKKLDVKTLTESLQTFVKYNHNLLQYVELLKKYQNIE